jgi:hypothetical protein
MQGEEVEQGWLGSLKVGQQCSEGVSALVRVAQGARAGDGQRARAAPNGAH